MSEPSVLVEDRDGIRILTLNAPRKLNAIDTTMVAELGAAVDHAGNSPSVRAVVVTGAGRSFCAGADPASLFRDLDLPLPEMREHLSTVYRGFLGLRTLPMPTIAAVHGPAIGAGLNIALSCDIVVAGPLATFGPTFAQIGLHPGGGCTWLLTERLGRARAAYLLLAAEPVSADEAWRIGLADIRAVDAQRVAVELAQRCAGRDPRLNYDIKTTSRATAQEDFAGVLALETDAQARSAASEAFRRHAARFMRESD